MIITNEIVPVQRAAVFKRLRELLIQQHDRLRNYLNVLDKQQDSIESANVEKLTVHVELEEQIVADIFSIQQVIDPLEEMYNAYIHITEQDSQDDIPALKAALEELKYQMIARSSYNRDLLSVRMAEINEEINTLKNNSVAAGVRRSVYQDLNSAAFVDIRG